MNWELAFWIALGIALWNGYMWLVSWFNYQKSKEKNSIDIRRKKK